MQATVNAGVYCRLSVDDPDTDESESIQTQKAMLTDYCHQHGFHIVDYFIDDGVSGTSFDRPDFRRMLDCHRIRNHQYRDLQGSEPFRPKLL